MTRLDRKRLPVTQDQEFLDRIKELHAQGLTTPEIVRETHSYYERVKKGFAHLGLELPKGKPGRKPGTKVTPRTTKSEVLRPECAIYDRQSCPIFCVEGCCNESSHEVRASK